MISFEKLNNIILYIFVFSLPYTAFSIFKIGGKDIIFSWFLIFLLLILNFSKIKKINKIFIIIYIWFCVLFLSIVKLEFLKGFISIKGFTQLLTMIGMMIHLFVLYAILKNKSFEEIMKLINILFFSTILLSLYSYYQYFTYFLTFLPKIDIFRNANIYLIYKGTGTLTKGDKVKVIERKDKPSFRILSNN